MCFSASASFTAAGVISVIGIGSLLKAHSHPLKMLALTPLFFALQQVLEGIVWLTLMQHDSTSFLHKAAVYGFLFFAGVFWPIWLPACLCFLEDNKKRQQMLFIILLLGIMVASRMFFRLVTQHHTAFIEGHHMTYPMFTFPYDLTSLKNTLHSYLFEVFLAIAYLIAVIGPFFTSSINKMWVIGIIILLGFIAAEVFYSVAFASVWCFFAALSTIATYYIVKNYNKTHLI